MKIPYGYIYKRHGGKRFAADSKVEGTFYFSNPGPDKKERPVSLKTKNRVEAEQRVVAMCGRVDQSDRQEWLMSLIALGDWARGELSGLQEPPIPLTEVWSAFDASRKRKRVAPKTLSHYETIWGQFDKWSKVRIHTLPELNLRLCEQYIAHCEQGNMKESTITKHIDTLRYIFRIVCPDRENPWVGLHTVKISTKRKKRALEPDEVVRILSACRRFAAYKYKTKNPIIKDDSPLKAEFFGIHLISYWTGLRLYDCIHMRASYIDRSAWVIRIVPKKVENRKPEPLIIPVSEELKIWLSEYESSSHEFLFPNLVEVYDVREASITRWLNKIWEDAKVFGDERGTATFHSLRVTFQTLMDTAGRSRVHTRAVTGHSSSTMSDAYSRMETEEGREAVRGSIGVALPTVMG